MSVENGQSKESRILENYLGLDLKTLGLFIGLVLGTGGVVTLVFGFVFGFDRWRQNVQTASQLMTAANMSPVGAVPQNGQAAAGQFVCPQHGAIGLPQFDAAGVPHCPLDGLTMSLHQAGAGGMALAAAPG